MIIKSFNLNDLKKTNSSFFLLYGENEGQKEDAIFDYFLKDFEGEIIRYDEDQILTNKEVFFEVCLNDSLFENEKIIQVNRVTTKLYNIIKEITEKKVRNKKIIFNSGILDKNSKIRKLFEIDKKLICIAFYKDNNLSLIKIANNFFKKNNIVLSNENINLIIENCSEDRKNLYNAMDKILNFCLNKKKISRVEILKLINFNQDDNYFELIDNCLAKNHLKVSKIINYKINTKINNIILLRSFLSRLKRLINLKKLHEKLGNINDTLDNFKPTIFWKDKELVEKQIKIWSKEKIYLALDEVNNIELKQKKNPILSNNLIYDFILNTTNS